MQPSSFERAEQLLELGRDDDAARLYEENAGRGAPNAAAAAFRLGEIANRAGDVAEALRRHRQVFDEDPAFARLIVPESLPHHGYRYAATEQTEVDRCPLCGGDTFPHGVYSLLQAASFTAAFEPVRMWRHCRTCHHLAAGSRPARLESALKETTSHVISHPDLDNLHLLGRTLRRLVRRGNGGRELLDVGVGAGLMAAVALELDLNVEGLDIRTAYADQTSETLGIAVARSDFIGFDTDRRYDFILMGDVLEHFADPLAALRKAGDLLARDGLLWISTPNFESAHVRLKRDQDALWRVCEHLQFFSRKSLELAIATLDLEVIDYQLSAQYRGSMELTARPAARG